MNRSTAAMLTALVLATTLTACSGGTSTSTQGSAGTTAPARTSGSIAAAGSTALLPLVKQAAQDYQTKYPDINVSVSGGGSRVGITQAAQKGVDIGDSDILAPGEPTLVDHKVAVATFAIVANPAVGVKNLTSAQARDIFSGKTTNFKQVGGIDQAITVINRPRSSGTRAVFVANVMGGVQPMESGTQDSSGTVASMVSTTPGAISYVSTSYVRGGNVVALALDGVAPTAANVTTGKYKFWSYEHMFTNGPPSKQVAAFIAYVQTDTVALAKLGFIPVAAMKVK
jgi:phosphate transport system substrate-binding protein